jgi:hypothetical protein
MVQPTTVVVRLELEEEDILLLDSALTKLIEVKYHHMNSAPGGPDSISTVYARAQYNRLWTIRRQLRTSRKEHV